MPELPEVETIRRQLDEVLVGKMIKKITVLKDKSFCGDEKSLVDCKIERVGRKAKILEIFFSGNSQMLIVHLKMTGQLVYVDGKKRIAGGHPTADWVSNLPRKHTRVIIDFSDGGKLFFNDMRSFGWMKIVEKVKYESEIRNSAPDVTDKEFTLKYFSNLIIKTNKVIKQLLMDQEMIGGVGNIYANDALYLAKVMPNRKTNSLSRKEIKKIYDSIKMVINKGIKYGGASAANYVDTKGMGGTYQNYFLVYKKDGKKCFKCGEKISKIKLGGRGTYFCPICQK